VGEESYHVQAVLRRWKGKNGVRLVRAGGGEDKPRRRGYGSAVVLGGATARKVFGAFKTAAKGGENHIMCRGQTGPRRGNGRNAVKERRKGTREEKGNF